MNALTVKDLYLEMKKRHEKGQDDYIIFVTDDEEGNGYHALWYKGQTPKQMGKNRPYFENANHDISLLVNGTSKAVYLG